MSQEKIKNLRAFGARVVVTPTAVEAEDPRSYYQVSRRIAKETPNSLYMNQYDNLSNRECHYHTTGPEILRQFPDIDYFIAGIGTGGTICGVGRYLKEHKPDVKVVAVDPVGSIVYEYFKTGKMLNQPKTYKIEGIGEDFIPKNYDFSVIDDMIQVEDKESFLMTRDLLTREGLYCGISSGSAVVGAIKWLQAQGAAARGKKAVTILCDSGNRYTSKVFDDDWMREAGFLDTPSLGTVRDLLRVVGLPPKGIRMVSPSTRVSAAIDELRTLGISQLPVRDEGGWIKGIVSEGLVLSALYSGKVGSDDPVSSIMDASIEFVNPDDTIEKVSKLVTSGKVPLVVDPSKSDEVMGIITKIDLLSYLGGRK
jgi:cystathionine beta-synthase